MQKNLVVLSDMYGYPKGLIPDYMKYEYEGYSCKYYDLQILAEIDPKAKDIHSQFVDNGINTAVKNLLDIETRKVSIISFSMSGAVAWKAAQYGLKVDHLVAISSTRLRFETKKPNCKITLLYGENDYYKPDYEWITAHNLNVIHKPGMNHELYKEKNLKTEIELILSSSY